MRQKSVICDFSYYFYSLLRKLKECDKSLLFVTFHIIFFVIFMILLYIQFVTEQRCKIYKVCEK